jgi:hypothetical protein
VYAVLHETLPWGICYRKSSLPNESDFCILELCSTKSVQQFHGLRGLFQPVNFKEVTMKTIFTLLALAMVAVFGTSVAAPQTDSSVIRLAAAQYPNEGKVLEVIETSMYTYLQVSSDNGPVWIAASKVSVSEGSTIGYGSGAVMKNFYSKTLNRSFGTIIFLDKVEILK